MSDERYWAGRVARFGHTGWSDAGVYAYDQRLRLRALAALLDGLPTTAGCAALDFGCGVGDFCALLARRGHRVVGHDLSPVVLARAARYTAGAPIHFEAELGRALAPPLSPYGLVLCVTVLQHVVDDAALAALLKRLAAALQPGGYLVALETFAAAGAPVSGYLKRRALPALVAACADAGLRLRQQRGFYHPTEGPTAAYTAYRRRPAVRVLSRLADWRVPGAVGALRSLAGRAAAHDADAMDHRGSPTQWLVFERVAARAPAAGAP